MSDYLSPLDRAAEQAVKQAVRHHPENLPHPQEMLLVAAGRFAEKYSKNFGFTKEGEAISHQLYNQAEKAALLDMKKHPDAEVWEIIKQLDPRNTPVLTIDPEHPDAPVPYDKPGRQRALPESVGLTARSTVFFHDLNPSNKLPDFFNHPDDVLLDVKGGFHYNKAALKRALNGQTRLKPAWQKDGVQVPLIEGGKIHIVSLTHDQVQKFEQQSLSPENRPITEAEYGFAYLPSPDHECQDRIIKKDLLDSQGRVIGIRLINIDMSGGSGSNEIVQDKLNRIFIPGLVTSNQLSGKDALVNLNNTANNDPNPAYGAVLITDFFNDQNRNIESTQKGDNGLIAWSHITYPYRRNPDVWNQKEAGGPSNFQLQNFPDHYASYEKLAGIGAPTGRIDTGVNANKIVRTVGGQNHQEPKSYHVPRDIGDFLLIGSDGIRPQQILDPATPLGSKANNIMNELYAARLSPKQAAEQICQAARDAGESDDISLIIVNL